MTEVLMTLELMDMTYGELPRRNSYDDCPNFRGHDLAALGCPDKLSNSSYAMRFKLEGDALSWWNSSFAYSVWVDIITSDQENSGNNMERFTRSIRMLRCVAAAGPTNNEYCMRSWEISNRADKRRTKSVEYISLGSTEYGLGNSRRQGFSGSGSKVLMGHAFQDSQISRRVPSLSWLLLMDNIFKSPNIENLPDLTPGAELSQRLRIVAPVELKELKEQLKFTHSLKKIMATSTDCVGEFSRTEEVVCEVLEMRVLYTAKSLSMVYVSARRHQYAIHAKARSPTEQKSYADKHRRDLEFQVRDRVFLKVSPFRGVKHFGIKGKLSPRFIGPFEILERIRVVSYRLALPPQLSHVHDVFHVSLLRGYHYHLLHVASYPFDQIQPDMSLSEEPESILDRSSRESHEKPKFIPFMKILWKKSPRA
ncbi:hypothetical protein Tco_0683825 [Tanacetum coccineum]